MDHGELSPPWWEWLEPAGYPVSAAPEVRGHHAVVLLGQSLPLPGFPILNHLSAEAGTSHVKSARKKLSDA